MQEHGNEVVYLGGEVQKSLGIPRSSLTKYCLSLESKGYHFIKDKNNSRRFTTDDILLLRRMKDLIQEKGMTMETAANVVLSMLPDNTRTRVILDENKEEINNTPMVPEQAQEQENKVMTLFKERLSKLDKLDELEKHMEAQMEFNRLLLARLDQQDDYIKKLERYIEDSLNKRDIALTEQLRISMKEQQQAMIEAAATKKGWLSKIFGK